MNGPKLSLMELYNAWQLTENQTALTKPPSMAGNVERNIFPEYYDDLAPKKRTHSIATTNTTGSNSVVSNPKTYTNYEKSPSSRVHHNQLEKQRRESMRGLYEQLKAIVPVEYRGERPSTAKLLTSAARFIQIKNAQVYYDYMRMQEKEEYKNELIRKIREIIENKSSTITDTNSQNSQDKENGPASPINPDHAQNDFEEKGAKSITEPQNTENNTEKLHQNNIFNENIEDKNITDESSQENMEDSRELQECSENSDTGSQSRSFG